MDRDRNLLFGIMAVQLRMVSADQLVDIAGSWATDSSRGLPQRMQQSGILSQDDCEALLRLVEQAVRRAGGDSAQAIESLGGEQSISDAFSGSIAMDGGELVRLNQPSTHPRPPSTVGDNDDIGVAEARGRYTFVREHGRGGMGRILHVNDQYLGRDIALKELLPRVLDNGDGKVSKREPSNTMLARFLQEARVTGQLEHPSVVPVYELGHRQDGTPYYTMKLVRGQTLAACFEKAKSLRDRLAYLPHLSNLCQAIAYAHSRNIIHRDIKPGNVMIGEFGETVVIDWGLAKVAGQYDLHAETLDQTLAELSEPESASVNTLLGQILGTPSYMPPEQARGDVTRIDERSDVYSLGAVLYTLLTGKPPFTGLTAREVLSKVKNESPVPVSTLEPFAPKELAAICARAMEKAPEKRYQSAKDLVDEIQRFQSGALVQAYDYNVAEHLRRFIRRYQTILVTGAAAAAILFIVGLFYHLRLQESHDRLAVANSGLTAAKDTEHNLRLDAQRENYFALVALAKKNIDELRFDRARDLLAACPVELRHFEWGLLQHLCNLGLMTLPTEGQAKSLCVSKDGSLLAFGDSKGNIRIHSFVDGTELGALKSVVPRVKSLAFNPDGTHLAIAGGGATAKVIDWKSGEQKLSLKGHTRAINCIAYGPDGQRIATGASDNTVMLWDAATGTSIATLEGHFNDITALSFDPQGRWIASASRDNSAVVWSLDTFGIVSRIAVNRETNDMTAISFSPDGAMLATGGLDREFSVCLWRPEDGSLIKRIPESARVNALRFSPDGRLLACASDDNAVTVWNWESEERERSFLGHSDLVNALVFNASGDLLATASSDATVKFWDVQNDSRYARMRVSLDGPNFVRFAVNTRSNRVVAAGNYGAAVVWDLTDDKSLATLDCETVDAMELSGDGKRLLTLRANGSIAVVDTETGERVWSRRDKNLVCAALNTSGSLLAMGHKNGNVVVVDLAKDTAVLECRVGQITIAALAFTPESNAIAVASSDWNVEVWDLVSQSAIAKRNVGARVSMLHFSPDSSTLALGGNAAQLWKWRDGETAVRLMGEPGNVFAFAFSHSGERLVTGNMDGVVALWETTTGREVLTLDRELAFIESLALSDDEKTLVVVGELQRAGDTLLRWQVPAWDEDSKGDAPSARTLVSREPLGKALEEHVQSLAGSLRLASRDASKGVERVLELSTEDYSFLVNRVADLLKDKRDERGYRGRKFVSEGMFVEEVRSFDVLDQLGLKPGDIISTINDMPLTSYDAAIEELERISLKRESSMSVGVLKDGVPVLYTLTTPSLAGAS